MSVVFLISSVACCDLSSFYLQLGEILKIVCPSDGFLFSLGTRGFVFVFNHCSQSSKNGILQILLWSRNFFGERQTMIHRERFIYVFQRVLSPYIPYPPIKCGVIG